MYRQCSSESLNARQLQNTYPDATTGSAESDTPVSSDGWSLGLVFMMESRKYWSKYKNFYNVPAR